MDRLRKSAVADRILHHAYHLVGKREDSEREVLELIRDVLQVKTEGNPDVMVLRYVSLSVHDARELKDLVSKKPLGKAQYCIVSFQFATTEAQNALLKLFEEPSGQTHFFIITPSAGTLVATVRSRVERVRGMRSDAHEQRARLFLSSTPKKRMHMLKDAIDAKDKEHLLALIGELEVTYMRSDAGELSEEWKDSVDALIHARQYLHGKSASVKMIGEYLAAVLERVAID